MNSIQFTAVQLKKKKKAGTENRRLAPDQEDILKPGMFLAGPGLSCSSVTLQLRAVRSVHP